MDVVNRPLRRKPSEHDIDGRTGGEGERGLDALRERGDRAGRRRRKRGAPLWV